MADVCIDYSLQPFGWLGCSVADGTVDQTNERLAREQKKKKKASPQKKKRKRKLSKGGCKVRGRR